MPLRALASLDDWTVRRAGGRLGPALRILLAVTAAYAVAWIIVAVLANLLAGGRRSDAWAGFVTVPMVLVQAPWALCWMPSLRFGHMAIAGYRRLGLRRGVRILYVVGGLLAIVEVAVCFAALLATFAA